MTGKISDPIITLTPNESVDVCEVLKIVVDKTSADDPKKPTLVKMISALEKPKCIVVLQKAVVSVE